MTAPPDLFGAIRYDLERVEELLPVALAARHASARRAAASGMIGDPTGDAATDGGRMAVREAVRKALVALAVTQREVYRARVALAEALDRIDGGAYG